MSCAHISTPLFCPQKGQQKRPNLSVRSTRLGRLRAGHQGSTHVGGWGRVGHMFLILSTCRFVITKPIAYRIAVKASAAHDMGVTNQNPCAAESLK